MGNGTLRRSNAGSVAVIAACLVLVSACEGWILGSPARPGARSDATDGALDPSVDGGSVASGTDAGLPGPPPACEGALDVGASPLARYSRRELGHVVRDVIGIDARSATTIAQDGTENVYGYIANRAEIDPVAARGYLDFAADVAARAPITTLTECRADGCVGDVVETLGMRLIRRPVFADERERYVALYEAGRAELGLDVPGGMRLVLEAMLQSPSFLVRGEEAIASSAEEIAPLDGYEIATRLASFVWMSVPDEELLDAAGRGELATVLGIEAQAIRMLADPRADRMYRDFHLQWLGVRRPEGDATPHTDDAALVTSMREEANAFFSHVGRNGTFEDLFTSSESFVDARLATDVYGITAPAGTGMVRTALPSGRSGVFTLPLFLGSKIEEGPFSPIHLGVGMIRRFMCQDLDNPPEGALEINAGLTGTPREVSRQRNELFCSTCHARIDPIGFLFYGFDHLGRPRRLDEAGDPVVTEGTVAGLGALDGTYADIADFAGALATEPAVRDCYLGHFMTYALGRAPGAGDQCSVDAVRARFDSSGHRISDVVLAIVTSDAFRHRRTTTEISTCE